MAAQLWIKCRMDGKNCILARDERAYYIIQLGKGLDYVTAEWLEQQGISQEILKELCLPFEYIPGKVLQSLSFSGFRPGDVVCLHLKRGRRTLELAEALDKDFIREFFPGVLRVMDSAVKPSERQNPGWRKAKQDPELYEKLKWVPAGLAVLTLVAGAGVLLDPNAFWFSLWLAAFLTPLLLVILMPCYFTLFFSQRGKKPAAWTLEVLLVTNMGIALFGTKLNWLDERYFWPAIGICAVAATVLCLLAEEFRRKKAALMVAFLYGGLVGLFLTGQINEVYAPEEPQAYILEVEDTHISSGSRSTSYYCTVTLPDGREVELSIPRSLYVDLEEGDYVRVEIGEGFFGIEYANVYPHEEGE